MSTQWRLRTASAIILAFAACNNSDEGGNLPPGATGAAGLPMTAAGTGSGVAGTTVSGSAGAAVSGIGVGTAGSVAIGGTAGSAAAGAIAGGGGVGGSVAGGAGSAGSAGEVGGAGGAAAGGGGGGSAAQPPFEPTGMPITGPDKQWTWVPFPDSKCRDGSMAGLSVNMNSASKKVVFYLEGGGSCFDSSTCGSNPANIPASAQMPGAAGIFDRTQSANPVRDWNWVYVPYCTGDVHIGDLTDVTVAGVTGSQQFVGRRNVEAFLNRVVPTFKSADQVLLTGISAGGFGASSNIEFVQWAFGSIPVTMLDDSGPAMSNKFIPPCLSALERKLWGLDNTILKLCGADCPDGGDFIIDYSKHVAKLSTGVPSGLIESNQDQVIRWFYGIGTDNGKNDCMGVLLSTPMDGMLFEQGLLDFRMLMTQIEPSFNSYFPASTQHTWLTGASFFTQTTDNVKMVDWVTSIINGKSPGNVGM